MSSITAELDAIVERLGLSRRRLSNIVLDGGTEQILAGVVTITPEIAERWLATINIDNRKPKWSAMSTYSRDMASGAWMLTGQGIIVDWDGHLIDGQNRLTAIIKADKPVRVIIVIGVDPSCWDVIDRNVIRTNADEMTHRKIDNATAVSALVDAVVRAELGVYDSVKISPHDSADCLTRHGERILLQAALVSKLSKAFKGRGVPVSGIAALCYLMSFADDVLADRFVADLLTGIGRDGNAAVTLHDRMAATSRTANRLDARTWRALTIRAWNAYYHNQPLHLLKWDGKAMPQIEGIKPANPAKPGYGHLVG